jgi:hypothetical protein
MGDHPAQAMAKWTTGMLAQASPVVSDQARTILLWLGLAIALAVAIGVGGFILRRIMLSRDQKASPHDPGFTLDDLRAMHRTGQISDEEFARAKARMIAAAKAEMPGPGFDPPRTHPDEAGADNEDSSDPPR